MGPWVAVQGSGPYWLRAGDRRRTAMTAPPGWISLDEHIRAWERYRALYGDAQSWETIASRGGFGYAELVRLLGRHPTTYRPAAWCPA